MKYRPIIFSAPMVRALLDGTKTQTRREVKPQPPAHVVDFCTYHNPKGEGLAHFGFDPVARELQEWFAVCPYGQPGDRLWVREAFDFLPSGDPDQPQVCEIVYWATGSHEEHTAPEDYNPMIYGHEKIRPSIHMPRWASRITLEITGVRVERLNNISEADANAEGVRHSLHLPGGRFARGNYAHLWWTIHGDGSWEANPWVWVVEFKVVKP